MNDERFVEVIPTAEHLNLVVSDVICDFKESLEYCIVQFVAMFSQ